jgi:hypothetical protein
MRNQHHNVTDPIPGPSSALSPSRIGNYEQGIRRLQIEQAHVFAKIFRLHAAYFVAAISRKEADVLTAMQG